MSSPNILLTRIDNRLLHGQTLVWTKTLNANLVICADDVLANDNHTQIIMKMTADSAGVGIRFFTLQKTIEVIHKASPKQKIFILCRTPQSVETLLAGGVPITDLNVGNMHFVEGKTQLSKKVYVNDEDMKSFRNIEKNGVNVFIQDVPGDTKQKIN